MPHEKIARADRPFGSEKIKRILDDLSGSLESLRQDMLSYRPASDVGGRASSRKDGTTVKSGHRHRLEMRAIQFAYRAQILAHTVIRASKRDAVLDAVEEKVESAGKKNL